MKLSTIAALHLLTWISAAIVFEYFDEGRTNVFFNVDERNAVCDN